jgi:hypothetical protein
MSAWSCDGRVEQFLGQPGLDHGGDGVSGQSCKANHCPHLQKDTAKKSGNGLHDSDLTAWIPNLLAGVVLPCNQPISHGTRINRGCHDLLSPNLPTLSETARTAGMYGTACAGPSTPRTQNFLKYKLLERITLQTLRKRDRAGSLQHQET